MDDFERKYKGARERARKLQENSNGMILKKWLWSVFPELKESNGEIMRKMCIEYLDKAYQHCSFADDMKNIEKCIAWLEKRANKTVDCPQTHQDVNHPNGGIVMEDFSGGEGFYKLHLDYLNKNQIEEVEEMVRTWNKETNISNENIKNCIGMCLTDANEQRFNDYGTTLKDCLAWLEKQDEQKPADKVEPRFKVGDKIRRKTPRRYDKDMQVARVESDYYICNHLGKFSSEPISFSEESNYELIEQKPAKIEPKFKVD